MKVYVISFFQKELQLFGNLTSQRTVNIPTNEKTHFFKSGRWVS
jgi:hypothetical protein